MGANLLGIGISAAFAIIIGLLYYFGILARFFSYMDRFGFLEWIFGGFVAGFLIVHFGGALILYLKRFSHDLLALRGWRQSFDNEVLINAVMLVFRSLQTEYWRLELLRSVRSGGYLRLDADTEISLRPLLDEPLRPAHTQHFNWKRPWMFLVSLAADVVATCWSPKPRKQHPG